MTKTPDTRPMRARLKSEIEPTHLIETVVATLCAEANKPVTTRIEAKVTAALTAAHGPADYKVHLTRSYGMTNLEWGGYTQSQGNRGRSILLSHSTTSAPIGERYITDMKRLVAAIHERNAVRKALLASDAPERMDDARHQIAVAYRRLRAIHDADENYSVLPSAHTLVEEIIPPR